MPGDPACNPLAHAEFQGGRIRRQILRRLDFEKPGRGINENDGTARRGMDANRGGIVEPTLKGSAYN